MKSYSYTSIKQIFVEHINEYNSFALKELAT